VNSHKKSHRSGHDLLKVRHHQRLRLCQTLTAIGSVFLLVFGVISLIDRSYTLGAVLLISMSVGIVNIYALHITGNIERAVYVLNGILFVLSLTLLVTGGKDNTGILWIYPIVAINLFVNRFWPAVYLYGTFLIVSGLLLFSPLSELLIAEYSRSEAIRFELTLLALWAICLAALRSEEQAYHTLLKLHDDDIHKLAYFDTLTGLPNR